MEEEIAAASVGQEPPFVGASADARMTADNIGSTNTNSPTADNNSTTTNNNIRPRRLHFRIRNQNGTQININTNTTSEGRRRININATPQVLRNNTTPNQQQSTPLRSTGARGPIVVPPLEPQPLPHQQTNNVQDESGTSNDNVKGQEDDQNNEKKKKDMKKFECAICVEYMDNPTGCGNSTCGTRFCYSCLERVLNTRATETNTQQQQQPTNPPRAKCPHCRSIFTLQTMVKDDALKKEMEECNDTVTCPFVGCDTKLHISQVKAHEAQCQYMRVRCRFCDWGCSWTGKKMDVMDHDLHQCEFRGGLGKLVNEYRNGSAQRNHLLQQHHMQLMASSQMFSMHSRQILNSRTKNPGSILNVLQLAYEATLFPGQFAAMRELWSSMIAEREAFAMVLNILLLMPSMGLMFNVTFQGFKLFAHVQLDALSKAEGLHLVETLLLSATVLVFGLSCIAFFFFDDKSSMEWTMYNVGNFMSGSIYRDLAAICMAVIHFVALELRGQHPGLLLWLCTTIVTVFFTTSICRIVEKNDPSSMNIRLITTSRARPPIIFGLRYGLLASLCGFSPSINAVATLRLLKKMKVASSLVTQIQIRTGDTRIFNPLLGESECFLPRIDPWFLLVAAGLATAFDYSGNHLDAIPWWNIFVDWISALAILLYVNAQVYFLEKVGIVCGDKNLEWGNMLFQKANLSFLPGPGPSPAGCFILGISSFLLLCIAVV